MPPSDALKQTVGRALGRVPSGLYILTATAGAESMAILASWVQQASFDPPTISVAMSRDRAIGPFIRQHKRFTLSVLGEHDSALMKKYARGIDAAQDPFAGVNTATSAAGAIYLADALAYLDCRLETVAEFNGAHDLFIATVTDGAVLRDGHSFTHVRGNGFHY